MAGKILEEKMVSQIQIMHKQGLKIKEITYSGVYPFTFSGDVRSLFVQKRLGRCKINTFS